MAERQYHLKFDNKNAQAVDEYLEYKRIVGDDDGGELMTPDQFEEYKKKVLPMRMKNRLFVSYSAPTGMDCKMIGPETPCFCTHRYKQHKTDFEVIPTDRPIKLPCRQRGCKCATYHFAPLNGSQPIRCTCKHTSEEHSEEQPYRCKKRGCIKCTGFTSSFTCGCGGSYKQHKMIVETAEEREARGHPIGQATPYAAMGGITGFSSLADGYMRLDPSGRGAPNKGFLEQSITSADNPFLRSNVQAIKSHQMQKNMLKGERGQNKQLHASGIDDPDDEIFSDLTERVSQMKRPGEADMDYYERRYQERKAGGKGNATDSYGQLGAGQRKAINDKPRSARTPQPKK
ncbi:protein FAM221A-like isoform X1 [Mytilus californianus]|uniref:protein FAM221A-like isoform X1 n=1 Tax=Mytilus californianus TaxID=6549 RepID=UPI0022455B17|nr:protein FAM221A-like isoform X1 [Mytilus californianus]